MYMSGPSLLTESTDYDMHGAELQYNFIVLDVTSSGDSGDT